AERCIRRGRRKPGGGKPRAWIDCVCVRGGDNGAGGGRAHARLRCSHRAAALEGEFPASRRITWIAESRGERATRGAAFCPCMVARGGGWLLQWVAAGQCYVFLIQPLRGNR